MPKLVDYPRSSLKRSLEMAKAIDDLGGECNMGTCADKMGLKVSGGFHAIIGGGTKFGLVKHKKGSLSTTDLYKSLKNSYDDKEETKYMREAFLNPPLFKELYDRFKGLELPITVLDKMLIREFGVDEKVASRVSKYFIDGAKSVSLLDEANRLASDESVESPETGEGLAESEKGDAVADKDLKALDDRLDRKVPDNFTKIETEFFTLVIEKTPETWDLLERMLPIYKKRLNIRENEEEAV